MKILWGILIGLILLTNAMVGFAIENPLSTHTAHYQIVAKRFVLDSTVEAVHRATVSSQVNGRVVALNYDVNDYVKKGQILVQIESQQQHSKVDAAVANELEALALYDAAVEEFGRIKDIYEKKLVARTDYDKANTTLKSSKERLSAATAKLKTAQAQLKYSVVRAPYSGVVVQRHIEVGELAKAGQPLITGMSYKQLRVIATVPQRYVQKMRQNKSIFVLVPGQSGQDRIEINHMTLSPQADVQTHSFQLRANLPSNLTSVYPGQFLKLSFKIDEQKKLLIPTAAIVRRSELVALYVVDNEHQIQLRQIRIGQQYPDQQTEILAGLEEGERIALDPVQAAIVLKGSR